MSIATQLAPAILDCDAPPPSIRRFTVEEYLNMIEAGVFHDGERLELLEGWIVRKMTIKPPHAVTVGLVSDAIRAVLPAGWHIRNQDPTITEDSVPEPDVSIVRGPRRDYLEGHPGPSDNQLVVEVSDSTLAQDRGRKRRLYARAGFPTFWIINLVDSKVEVHTDPTGPAADPTYRHVKEYGPDDVIPLVIEGREAGRIPVRDLLP